MSFIISQEFIKKAILNLAEDEQCQDLHVGSCNEKAWMQLVSGTKSVAKMYFIVHLIPILLGFKKASKNPRLALKKFAVGYGKSLLFVSCSLFVIRRFICLYTKFVGFSNMSTVYTGFMTGFPLLLQNNGRRTEISLYCFNNVMLMVYLIFKRRHPWLRINYGEGWLLAISTALLCFHYLADPDLFRSAYKKALNLVLKDV